jgi:hypothetical protein
MSAIEFLLRVRHDGDAYSASIRQFAATQHPEVRAVVGPVSRGEGATAPAAMLAAIVEAHIEGLPASRDSRYAC